MAELVLGFLQATRIVIGWTFQILRRFSYVSPRTTWAIVGCLTAARITRILTFLLPLKVILLAGSDGVPRYFRFFISPDLRDEWVIGLSISAIVSYAFTLVLEARSKQLSEKGSTVLLAASSVMAVVANQRAQAQGFYSRFAQVASAALFVAIGFVALFVLDRLLALYIAGLVSFFFLQTAWVLHGVTALKRTRLSDFVTLQLGNYLGVLSAVAFLSSFLVILYPFVRGSGGNILIAIICVVLLRQVLSTIIRAIKDAVALAAQKPLIDTLVFPDRRLETAEKKDHRTLRELFGRPERKRLASTELASFAQPGQGFRVEWRDPLLRGTAEFAIALEGGEAPAHHLRQRVFPPRFRHMVENEDLLFSHVARAAVGAPPLARHFVLGEHECLVWNTGSGLPPHADEWKEVPQRFLTDLWAIDPPNQLVSIYSASHSFLHQRLTDEFIARVDIAIDSDEVADFYTSFLNVLPSIRQRLDNLPLCLTNPGLSQANLVKKADGGYYLLDWGNWGLEPAGAGLLRFLSAPGEVERLLETVAERRPAMRNVRPVDIELARQCAAMEKLILRGQMKAGLEIAGQIMDMLQTDSQESDPPSSASEGATSASATRK